MSFTPIGESRPKITINSLREKKLRQEPITCLTAYDYPTARLLDEAGIDVLLVGDSLAQTVLGHENTLSVTLDEMLHHTRAVRRGTKHALLVADMPYGSYHVSADETVRNAAIRPAPRHWDYRTPHAREWRPARYDRAPPSRVSLAGPRLDAVGLGLRLRIQTVHNSTQWSDPHRLPATLPRGRRPQC